MCMLTKKTKQCSYLLLTITTVGIGLIPSLKAVGPDDDLSERKKLQAIHSNVATRWGCNYHPQVLKPMEIDEGGYALEQLALSKKLRSDKEFEAAETKKDLRKMEELVLNTTSQLVPGLKALSDQLDEDREKVNTRIYPLTQRFRKKKEGLIQKLLAFFSCSSYDVDYD